MTSIRRTLWGAFLVLTLLVVVGLALNLAVLVAERRQESRIVLSFGPLMRDAESMDAATSSLLSSARAYALTQQTQFQQQYTDAVREFNRVASAAQQITSDRQDAALLSAMVAHFNQLKAVCDRGMELSRTGHGAAAAEAMLEAARMDSVSADYAGTLSERLERKRSAEFDALAGRRNSLTMWLILTTLGIIGVGAWAVSRIERSLTRSINRQTRTTEEMIAGMPDGVMLVDGDGRAIFINPAAQQLLGTSAVNVPMEKQAEVYHLRNSAGRPLDAREMPPAQALSTGKPVRDVVVAVMREDGQRIAISMNAMPLREEHRVTGVIVTFRDITERRRLEEELQLEANRAQIIADAGAFFSSNVDPVWVTQAIAERTAEVLGDWAAVILKSPNSNELRVAAIYHRDMTSLGLAWSFIYRQPLSVGEGLIGQVVSTGYPSLTSNLDPSAGRSTSEQQTYHAVPMRLASLLILPLRTRREMHGALVIAANDPDRQMTDQKLPLAEVLAERAALAIENARLYTEQVEARRKVEALSRLKDEFLSIASHELRTPVTSIKGYTQLAKTLIREGDLPTSEEYLDVALDQIDRMSRLILELLDVSRIETGRLEIRRESIEWSDFVREVVHRHHTAVSTRRFHLDVPEETRVISGDRDRLEQVLGNLLENAVKYSPDGSDVFVKVSNEPERTITTVSDRGIGIPLDEIGQVFERFHRGRQVSSTNYGGLGLGLYIAKQIVERHGGTIWVESREGSGTEFHFSLPAEMATAPAAAAAS